MGRSICQASTTAATGRSLLGDFEGTRDTYAYDYLNTVPTAIERQGDFSQTKTSAGALIQVYDPYTTRYDPNRPSVLIRDPVPNNNIPASRLNTVASNLLKLVPLPTNSSLSNNYFYSSPFPNTNNSFRVRIDHRVNERNSLYASYGRLTSNGRYVTRWIAVSTDITISPDVG